MKTTIAYQCDASGAYLGETHVQEDVFQPGSFLLPPRCVLQAPPAFDPATHVPVFTGDAWSLHELPAPENPQQITTVELATPANRPSTGHNEVAVVVDGVWSVIADYRGTRYWLADGSMHDIVQPGETPPGGASLTPPVALPPSPDGQEA